MKPLKQLSPSELSSWKHVCVEFMQAYQDHAVDAMIGLCDQDSTVSFLPLGEQGSGAIQQLGKNIWLSLIDSFPDIDNTIHTIAADQGKIACKVSIRGTQAKDFAGIKSNGSSFDSEHIFVFEMDEQCKIKHLDVDWDHDDFVQQLQQ